MLYVDTLTPLLHYDSVLDRDGGCRETSRTRKTSRCGPSILRDDVGRWCCCCWCGSDCCGGVGGCCGEESALRGWEEVGLGRGGDGGGRREHTARFWQKNLSLCRPIAYTYTRSLASLYSTHPQHMSTYYRAME